MQSEKLSLLVTACLLETSKKAARKILQKYTFNESIDHYRNIEWSTNSSP